jgi:hypothetical protein
MWTLFKLCRWLITGLVALWLLATIFDGGLFSAALYGSFLILPLALLWVVPAIFRHRPPATKKHDPAIFKADVAHDNIAIDLGRDKLWIRDPARGERYLTRGQVLEIRTGYDSKNGIANQRLEFQISDVAHPLWQVLFQRHSDRWKTTVHRNGEELNEWFARLRAWLDANPAKTRTTLADDKDYSLAELHQAYRQAGTDDARRNWLVAFDVGCFSEGLDAQQEWERLGGIYPGPSPDLLRMQNA